METRSGRRGWRSAFAAAALLVALDARAGAPIAVRIYPLSGGAEGDPAAVDAQALLRSGLAAAVRRSDRLALGTPQVLPPTCGQPPASECLAKQAQGGVVLAGRVERRGDAVIVSLRAVAAGGAVHAFQVAFDDYLQSSEPFARALLQLEARLSPGGPTAVPAAPLRAPLPLPPPPEPRAAAPAAGTKAVADAPRPPAPAAPAPDLSARPPRPRERLLEPPEPQAAGGQWRRTAGVWTTAAGAALLAGGAAVAYLNRQQAEQLEERFKSSALTPADASRYRSVDTYNTVTTVLLVAGGLTAGAGIALWATAPDAGGASLRGRF